MTSLHDKVMASIKRDEEDKKAAHQATIKEYAGFWIRFVAALLDAVFYNILAFILGFIIGFVLGLMGVTDFHLHFKMIIIGNIILFLVYYPYFISNKGATFGKRILGLRIIGKGGGNISFGRAIGRELSKIISVLPIFIGFIMVGFHKEKRALHDIIAGTWVVKG